MTFKQFLDVLLNRWQLIVVCCLFLGVGAALGSKLVTPIYQATALVQVTVGNQSDYNSLLASQQLVQTEVVLATSDPVLREVASHYKGLTADQLANEVTATPKLNTQLFEINVQDADPARAATLANDVATTLTRLQLQITQQGTSQSNLQIVQNARPALNPVRPIIMLNTGAGLLAGLLLGILLAVLLEKLKMRGLTSEALAQLLDMPVIATVWHTGSKQPEDLINPRGDDPNIESYRMLCTSIGLVVDKSLEYLMVTSALPSEGKSTVAANLAISMARTGKNTLLIDANLYHPTVHKLFKLSPESSGLSDAIHAYSNRTFPKAIPSPPGVLARQPNQPHASPADPSMDPPLQKFLYSGSIPNLWVMPAGSLRPDLPELLTSKTIQQILNMISKSRMDFVIFDAPAMLSASNASVLASKVDDILVVIDTQTVKKNYLEQMKALLARTQTNVLGCVANKQRQNPKDTVVYYQIDTVATLNVDGLGEEYQVTQISENRESDKLNGSLAERSFQ